jgi:hypothetical protein
LDADAMALADAANDGAGANLTNRQIDEKLEESTHRELFLGANEKAAYGEVIDERDSTLRTCLPSGNDAFGRFHAGVFSQFAIGLLLFHVLRISRGQSLTLG